MLEMPTKAKWIAFVISLILLGYQIFKGDVTATSLLNDVVTWILWLCVGIWLAPLIFQFLESVGGK